MMKSKWLVLAVLILSMLTFTACGKKKEESFEEVDPEAVVEEAQKEVEEADAKKDEFLADFTGEMDLTGSWQDEVSQRATMDVEKAETGTYHILIHWASGASAEPMMRPPECCPTRTATTRFIHGMKMTKRPSPMRK